MNEQKKKIKYRLKVFLQKLLLLDLFILFDDVFIVWSMFIYNIIVDIFENKMNERKFAIFTKFVWSILNDIHHFMLICSHNFLSISIVSNELFVFSFAKYRIDFSRSINCSSILEVIIDIHRSKNKLSIFKQYKIVRRRFCREFEWICY